MKLMKPVKTQFNEIMKISKDMKVEFNKEVKSLKKTQTEIKVEIEYLGCQIKSSEVSLTNRLQGMKERLSGVEDKVAQSRKTLNLKRSGHKIPRKTGTP